MASISEACRCLRETGGESGPRDHAQRRARVVAAIDRERDKVSETPAFAPRAAQADREHRTAQDWGELIFAYLWQIQPGDTAARCRWRGGPARSSPERQGQCPGVLRGVSQGTARRKPASRSTSPQPRPNLAYLEQLRIQVEHADGFAAIETLRQEFDEHTGGRQPVGERAGNRSKKQAPRKVTGLTECCRQRDIHRALGPRERPGNVRYRWRRGYLAARARCAGLARHHPLAATGRAMRMSAPSKRRRHWRPTTVAHDRLAGGRGRCHPPQECPQDQGRRSRDGDVSQRADDRRTAAGRDFPESRWPARLSRPLGVSS